MFGIAVRRQDGGRLHVSITHPEHVVSTYIATADSESRVPAPPCHRYTEAASSADPACFSGCPGHPYNASAAYVQDGCWVECFVDTIFTVPSEDLEGIWLQAFASDDPRTGGCPPTKP